LAYANKGNQDQAIADYDMAISLDPKFSLAHYRRGMAYAVKGDNDRAIEAFDAAININSENSEAYGNRGLAYIKKGDYDHGIADLDKAISLDPTYGVAYYNRGEAHNKKGETQKALADLKQAITLLLPADSENGKAHKLIVEIEQKIAEAAAAAAKAELAKKQAEAKAAAQAAAQLLQATQAAGKRVALVIGNSDYQFADELPNPRNDAQAMGQLLSAMGFKVISGMDLTKPEFETKIAEFSAAAKTAELSLFFYAGHGLQVAGRNYLFPVDAKVENDNALNF
jgi:tetratricopeptide (TPR) repeat protein